MGPVPDGPHRGWRKPAIAARSLSRSPMKETTWSAATALLKPHHKFVDPARTTATSSTGARAAKSVAAAKKTAVTVLPCPEAKRLYHALGTLNPYPKVSSHLAFPCLPIQDTRVFNSCLPTINPYMLLDTDAQHILSPVWLCHFRNDTESRTSLLPVTF